MELVNTDLTTTVFVPTRSPSRKVDDALHELSMGTFVAVTLPPPEVTAKVIIVPGMQGEMTTTSGAASSWATIPVWLLPES